MPRHAYGRRLRRAPDARRYSTSFVPFFPDTPLLPGKGSGVIGCSERSADDWGAPDADFYVDTRLKQPGTALDQRAVGPCRPEQRRWRHLRELRAALLR